MSATDQFKGYESMATASQRFAVVVPSDTVDLAKMPKALYFNSAGNVVLVGDDGNAVTFAVVANQTLDVRPTRVKATNTTVAANGIIALY